MSSPAIIIPLWKKYPQKKNSKLIDTLTQVNISSLFDPPKPKQLARQAFINLPLPPQAWSSNKKGELLIGKPTQVKDFSHQYKLVSILTIKINRLGNTPPIRSGLQNTRCSPSSLVTYWNSSEELRTSSSSVQSHFNI
jgi:hypothetical protein